MDNRTPEEIKEDNAMGILYSDCGYYVTKEGTKTDTKYRVWIPQVAYSTCDSTYGKLELAVLRCQYLADHRNK